MEYIMATSASSLPDHVRQLLADTLANLRASLVEHGYGYPWAGLHPRKFHPDMECVTGEELAAWKAACLDADAGTWTPDPGDYSRTSGSGETYIHVSATPWGLGGYEYEREPTPEEATLIARLEEALRS